MNPNRIHVAGLTTLLLCGFAAAEIRTGTGQSPLSSKSASGESKITEDEAIRRSQAIVVKDGNSEHGEANLVWATDRHPFGEDGEERLCWKIRFPSVKIESPNHAQPAEVEITVLVDAESGRFLAAFTRSREAWVLPCIADRNPEEEAKEDGWAVGPYKDDQLKATVRDVLARLWKDNDIDPRKAGQIILRPRFVACELPAIEKDGKLVPLRRPGTTWVIQVLGTVTLEEGWRGRGRPEYMSGLIALIDDETLKNFRGVYLP